MSSVAGCFLHKCVDAYLLNTLWRCGFYNENLVAYNFHYTNMCVRNVGIQGGYRPATPQI
ncbi:MAG: hypothetical protein AUK44_02610 [Porphyromonadaceae bacterium CG2_30_38_12]|nr:MAG: hypothetical protein AUK44_02610 [Porphyromonadaceae bacterium CG2_30_38_12]